MVVGDGCTKVLGARAVWVGGCCCAGPRRIHTRFTAPSSSPPLLTCPSLPVLQGKRVGDVVNRIHVAVPKARDGLARPPVIPPGVAEARARRAAGEKRRTEKDLQVGAALSPECGQGAGGGLGLRAPRAAGGFGAAERHPPSALHRTPPPTPSSLPHPPTPYPPAGGAGRGGRVQRRPAQDLRPQGGYWQGSAVMSKERAGHKNSALRPAALRCDLAARPGLTTPAAFTAPPCLVPQDPAWRYDIMPEIIDGKNVSAAQRSTGLAMGGGGLCVRGPAGSGEPPLGCPQPRLCLPSPQRPSLCSTPHLTAGAGLCGSRHLLAATPTPPPTCCPPGAGLRGPRHRSAVVLADEPCLPLPANLVLHRCWTLWTPTSTRGWRRWSARRRRWRPPPRRR